MHYQHHHACLLEGIDITGALVVNIAIRDVISIITIAIIIIIIIIIIQLLARGHQYLHHRGAGCET